MNKMRPTGSRENGSVLMTTIVLIVALTAAALTMMKISDFELKMTTNDKCQKQAFYNAESGLWSITKVIREICEESEMVNPGSPEFPGLQKNDEVPASEATDEMITDELIGFGEKSADKRELKLFDDSDISAVIDVDLNVAYTTQAVIRGNTIEFASGYEGLGGGVAGSTAIFYNITAEGHGCTNAQYTVNGEYRYMVGVSGGL